MNLLALGRPHRVVLARLHLDVAPLAEERPADAVHSALRAVVLVRDVAEDLLGSAPICGRERLIPLREEVVVGRGHSVRGDLGQLALRLQAEAVEVEIVQVVVERIFTVG